MGVIGKIRKRSGLLIIAIGGAMVLFILGDFLRSGRRSYWNSSDVVAVIGGNEVKYPDFEQKIQNELTQSYGSQPVDEAARESVRQRVWQMLLQELVMSKEYDELGISVNKEELFEQIKSNNPSPILAQYFTNPNTGRIIEQFQDPRTGALSSDRVLAYLKQLFESEQGSGSWLPVERAIKMDRFSTKYNTLLKKGLYVTSKEAKQDYLDKNKKANFRYVLQKYDALNDSVFSPSDAEIEAYYEEHKFEKEFQQDETTRSIEYIAIEVKPTDEDIEMIRQDLLEIKDEFTKTKEDTFFINQNSDVPEDFLEVSEEGKSFPTEVDSLIFHSDSGTVIGPFRDGEAFKLVKIMGFRMYPDSAKARHILVRIANGDTVAAKTKADSIMSIVKRQNNFEEMALKFSEDFQSAQDSGNLGWFKPRSMVPEFDTACFQGKVGELQMVQTQFGFHILQVTERAQPSRRISLGIIENALEPSKNTRDVAFNKASAFSINNNTADKFKQAGNELGIMVANYIKEGDKTIAGLENPRELIRWAYKAEIDDISEAFELSDKYVVAHLTEVKDKGTLSLDVKEIKERCRVGVIQDMKAEKLIKTMSGHKTIEELARAVGTEVQKVDQFTFSSYSVTGLGPEHTLIGKVFSSPQGKMSEPFKGNMGVFVIQLDQLIEPDDPTDVASLKKQLQQMKSGTVDYQVYNALIKAANVEDNRGKFY